MLLIITVMKKPAILIIALFLALSLQAQINYKVIKVSGEIEYVRTGSQMTLGDIFPDNEDLSFASPESRAAVINPDKGRFILTPQSASKLSGAKSNFLPAMSNISTRGGALNSLRDIQNYFSGSVSLLYRASWHINPYEFPQNDSTFFYIQYKHNGEAINKKLPFDGNSVVFSRSEILKVDGLPIESTDEPAINLFYYTPGGSQFISSFDLIIPEIEMLNTETEIILGELARAEYSRKVNELSGYLYEFYGKPDKQDVMIYLEKDFNLRK